MRKLTAFIILVFLLVNIALDLRASAPATCIGNHFIVHPVLDAHFDRISGNDTALLNKPAPAFGLYDLNGKLCDLAHLKGKVVVLNFWFVACKPCVNEMPALNAIKKKFSPEKVSFLALSLDKKAAIDAFLKEHTFDYTILPDAGPVADKYGLFAYPASMVIDAQGIIRFVQVGGPDIDKHLPQAISAVLSPGID